MPGAALIATMLMLVAVPVSAQQRDRVPDSVLRRASAGSWYVRALTIQRGRVEWEPVWPDR